MNWKCNYILGFVTLLVFTLGGCKQFEPLEPSGSKIPVFHVSGTADGADFQYIVNGAEFNAQSNSSKDSLDIMVHSGSIVSSNCSNNQCGPTLSFAIRGNGDVHADIEAKSYPYRYVASKEEIEIYTVTLSPMGLGMPASCDWTIDGEKFSTNGLETISFERNSNQPTFVEVALTANFAGGCSSTIENKVYLPHHGCDPRFSVESLGSNNHLLFTAREEIGSYQWSFESGVQSSSREVEYQFNNPSNDGIEFVSHKIEKNACQATWVRNVVVDDSLVDCNINFDYTTVSETKLIQDSSLIDISTAIIRFVDADGLEYTSEGLIQPEWSKCNVIDASDYTELLLGDEPYSKKVDVQFDVKLKAADGQILNIRNAEGAFPMGKY